MGPRWTHYVPNWYARIMAVRPDLTAPVAREYLCRCIGTPASTPWLPARLPRWRTPVRWFRPSRDKPSTPRRSTGSCEHDARQSEARNTPEHARASVPRRRHGRWHLEVTRMMNLRCEKMEKLTMSLLKVVAASGTGSRGRSSTAAVAGETTTAQVRGKPSESRSKW